VLRSGPVFPDKYSLSVGGVLREIGGAIKVFPKNKLIF
jgi:hypothetical protein